MTLKFQIFIFLIILLFNSCGIFDGEGDTVEKFYRDVYSLILTNVDGSSQKKIVDSNTYSKHNFLFNSDELIITTYDDILQLCNLDGEVINSIDFVQGIYEACISPDRNLLAFTIGSKQNKLQILSLNHFSMSDNTIKTIENSTSHHEFSFSFDGQKIVYIAGLWEPVLEIVDINTGFKSKVISEETKSNIKYGSPCFSRDDKSIFYIRTFTHSDSINWQIISIDTSGKNKKILIEENTYYGPQCISTNAHNNYLALSARENSIIMSYDMNYRIDINIGAENVKFSDDGSKLVVGNHHVYNISEIQTANTDGTNIQTVARGLSPVFSSDGLKILYVQKKYVSY